MIAVIIGLWAVFALSGCELEDQPGILVDEDDAGDGVDAGEPDPGDVGYEGSVVNESGPAVYSEVREAPFHFSGSSVDYECRLDDGQWESCDCPVAYSGLDDGVGTFDVRSSNYRSRHRVGRGQAAQTQRGPRHFSGLLRLWCDDGVIIYHGPTFIRSTERSTCESHY